jgi:hypothetical protein
MAGVPVLTRRRVARMSLGEPADVIDVAVLELAEPVPAAVVPARIRCVAAEELRGLRWWAFGFPRSEMQGNAADGEAGAALGYGWVRLDTASRYVVEKGFSGAGLWSPDYDAVVGVVGQAREAGENRGDGRALSLHRIDVELPGHQLASLARWSVESVGDAALAAWGWRLETDPEAGRHWRPRARGVSVDSERGYRFRGRRAALESIVSWLDRPYPDRRVLVVTGSPGVGKSAVLGRVVTTADPGIAAVLPDGDTAVRARVGSVACAVHAKGKSALDVATEIAKAASVALPGRVEDLAPALRARWEGAGGRFNLVVDALDEAVSPEQARILVGQVLRPLAETLSDVGVQVVVGSRRRDGGGDLLAAFAGGATVIDLDDGEYFAEEDLVAYVRATLQLTGDERPDNPYADPTVAGPVAARIAHLAGRNFLVGGLIARAHGLHDRVPVAPEAVRFAPTVADALDVYLSRLPAVSGVPAALALAVLAYADTPGLPIALWRVGLEAFGATVTAEALAEFARSSAANFLIESTGGDGRRGYRLFHQALNDSLRATRTDITTAVEDEQRLVTAWLRHARQSGWNTAPEYLRYALPGHADRAGMLDQLLTDDDYLLAADLTRLTPLADRAATTDGRRRARLLLLTPQAATARADQRAAMFTVTEALEGIEPATFKDRPDTSYTATWSRSRPRSERTVLEGHTSSVTAVCAVQVGGRELLASASHDGTVRLWDPETGQPGRALEGHTGWVTGVCAVRAGGRDLLASASYDRTVRLWDPETGQLNRVMEGHTGWVTAVCAVRVGGRELLASASGDRTVRLWDPETGQPGRALEGHTDWVTAVCAVRAGGRHLLASASYDRTVRLWDPETGQPGRALEGHTGWVTAVCAVQVGGRHLLASASYDRTVRLWDPTGREVQRIPVHHPATSCVQIGNLIIATSAGLLALRLDRL